MTAYPLCVVADAALGLLADERPPGKDPRVIGGIGPVSDSRRAD